MYCFTFMGDSFYVLVIIAIALIILLVKILFPKGIEGLFVPKGVAGEKHVAKVLSKLPQEEYKIINNLLISQNGNTIQIDHVVVSEYRIFVIETKFYQGQIYGGANSDYWTQNIFGNKYSLRNPIHQNYGHIQALVAILPGVHPDLFIPIVTFSRQASVTCADNKTVVYWDQLNEVILSYQRKWLTSDEAEKAYEILLSANIDSPENRASHVENVKKQIANREEVVANGYCPRCSGKLVLRNGKYGEFYGCINYPHCRYTHPV